MNAIKESLWRCVNCGSYHRLEEWANECCAENPLKVCEDCGTALDHKSYYTVCKSCREKRRFFKCKKMTEKEYDEKYPENYIVTASDNYYPDIDDMMESECYKWESEDDVPKYVYGTEPLYATVDIDNAIERALEDAYEDAEFDNTDELRKFVDEWNEKNKIKMFEEADIVIEIPEATRQAYIRLIKNKN